MLQEVAAIEGYGFAHYDATLREDGGRRFTALHVFRSTMYDYPGEIAGDPFAEALAVFLAGKCYTEIPHDEVIPSPLFDTDEGRAVTIQIHDGCPGQPDAATLIGEPHVCAVEALAASYAAS